MPFLNVLVVSSLSFAAALSTRDVATPRREAATIAEARPTKNAAFFETIEDERCLGALLLRTTFFFDQDAKAYASALAKETSSVKARFAHGVDYLATLVPQVLSDSGLPSSWLHDANGGWVIEMCLDGEAIASGKDQLQYGHTSLAILKLVTRAPTENPM